MRAGFELALGPAGAQQLAGHHIVPEGIQHAPGIGGQLDGVPAAFPGGLNPDQRLLRQHVVPLQKQHVGVIFIGGEGHHPAEFLHGFRLFPLEDTSAQLGVRPKADLLQQETVLYLHIPGKVQVQEPAVLLPDFPVLLLFQHLVHRLHKATPFSRCAGSAPHWKAAGSGTGPPSDTPHSRRRFWERSRHPEKPHTGGQGPCR